MEPYHITKEESAVIARALRAHAEALRQRQVPDGLKSPECTLERFSDEAFECDWLASLIEAGAEIDFWMPTG